MSEINEPASRVSVSPITDDMPPVPCPDCMAPTEYADDVFRCTDCRQIFTTPNGMDLSMWRELWMAWTAGCAASTGALVSPEQTTDHAVSRVSPVTDNMVEAAARALYEAGTANRFRNPPAWDSPEVERTCEKQRVCARVALSAALAGYTVVPTPEPHQVREDATFWLAEARKIAASVDGSGHPFVLLDSQLWLVTEAEAVGMALVAAAREARRLAAEETR